MTSKILLALLLFAPAIARAQSSPGFVQITPPSPGALTAAQMVDFAQSKFDVSGNPAPLNLTKAISNAVQRTVGNHLLDQINVLDFGIGAGGDDTTAYQNAMADSVFTGRRLWHPPGVTARISGKIFPPVGLQWVLDGTLQVLQFANAAAAHDAVDTVGGLSLSGFGIIDGGAPGQPTFDGSHASGGIVTSVSNAANVSISGITIRNFLNWPINLTSGISQAEVHYVTMHDSGNSSEFNAGSNCHFKNCTVYNITDQGISLYGGNTGCSVVGCTVYNCYDGIGINSDSGAPGVNTYCVIESNRVYSIRDFGIFVIGQNSNPSNEAWCVVRNNILWGNGTGGVAGCGSIKVQDAAGVDLMHNTIRGDLGTQPYSIWLNGPVSSCRVIGNRVIDSGVSGGAGANAICLTSNGTTPTNIIVTDNFAFDSRGGSAATAWAIFADSTFLGAGCVVRDNHAIGTFTSGTTPFQCPKAASTAIVDGYMTANNSQNIYDFGGNVFVGGNLTVNGALLDVGPISTNSTITAAALLTETTDPHIAGRFYLGAGNVVTVSAG